VDAGIAVDDLVTCYTTSPTQYKGIFTSLVYFPVILLLIEINSYFSNIFLASREVHYLFIQDMHNI